MDGARRKRDKSQFIKAWEDGRLVVKELNLLRIPIPDECALLRDWAGSRAPVFFDFSGCDKPEDAQFWCLIRVINGMAYGGPFLRENFIKYHSQEAKKKYRDFSELLGKINEIIEIIAQPRQVGPSDPRAGILRHRERLRRKRRRF